MSKTRRTPRGGAQDSGLTNALYRDLLMNPSPTSLAYVRAAPPLITEQLRAIKWSDVEWSGLILLGGRCHAVRSEQHRFISANLPAALSVADGFCLFAHWLWREAERSRHDPRRAVIAALTDLAAGPFVLREFERRLGRDGHVGAWAGMWFLIARWNEYYPDVAPLYRDNGQPLDELAAVTSKLSKTAWGHIRPQLRKGAAQPDALDAQVGAVAETILGRFGGKHPLEVLASGLDGGLNFVPKAIGQGASGFLTGGLPESPAHRKSENRRKEAGHPPTVIDFTGDLSIVEHRFPARESEEMAAIARLRLEEARRADPATYDALKEEDGHKARAAKKLKISRVTLDARTRRMAEPTRSAGAPATTAKPARPRKHRPKSR